VAHELTTRENGTVEMAFREGTEFPWHFRETQPQIVPVDATIDEWVNAAGMEWTVERAKTWFYAEDGLPRIYPNRDVLHRSDTKAPLGIVSPDYKILQPADCIGFFEDLVHGIGLEIDTAGTLFGGKRYWALASVGTEALLNSTDIHQAYLLLTSSADGTTATEARFTDVRVVCANTLRISMAGKAKSSVKLTHRVEFDADLVKQQLGVAPASFHEFMGKMRRLADFSVSDDDAQTLVKQTLGVAKDAKPGEEGHTFKKVMDLFRGLATGAELPGVAGTTYGLLNAYTETLDHKGKFRSDSHRLSSALTGAGDAAKAEFCDTLVALVS
jgi:phage/plasmid-like protein (TIGR03299 family)